MTHTTTGIAIGAVLALTALTLGVWAFLLVALFMALGAMVARVIDGQLDLRRLADVFRGRRSSS